MIELLEVNGEHWYKYSDTPSQTFLPVPSVTTILQAYPKGKQFYDWIAKYGDAAEGIKRAAGTLGTNVHRQIEYYLKPDSGALPLLSVRERITFLGFKAWHQKIQPQLIHSELRFIDSHYNYGGTIDFICEIGGEIYVIDFKSSNHIPASYWLQVAAYAAAYTNHKETPVNFAILHLNRSHPEGYIFLSKTKTDLDYYFKTFLDVYRVWKYDRAHPAM